MTTQRVVQTSDGIDVSSLDERQFKYLTLPNALHALVVSDPSTETASAAMDVRVGFHSDPEELPGLAHFCEHMLFLGTAKYPDENSYSVFLNARGGSSNAFTSGRDTNFYFDVGAAHLHEALDRFAQFFIAPLFTPSATERELNAVDSESANYLQDDSWRINQLERGLGNPKHPYHKFGVGNKETLGVTPIDKGLDVRDALLQFYREFYSASIMKLVLYGKEDVETLSRWVLESFAEVPNSGRQSPAFDQEQPYTVDQLARRLEVVPVMDWKVVQVSWVLPPLRGKGYSQQHASVLSHLIGHEGQGSLLSYLKEKKWANSVYAGIVEDFDEFSLFVVSFDVTEDGIERADDVLKVMFQYMHLMVASPWEKWMFDELEIMSKTHFMFQSKSPPADFTSVVAANMHTYPTRDIVSEGVLYFPFEWEQALELLRLMTPEQMRVLIACQTLEDRATSEEKWYGTKYREIPLPLKFLEEMANPGTNCALCLPHPNAFVVTELSLVVTELSLVDEKIVDTHNQHPQIIRDDDFCRVWYKPDVKFKKPRTFAVATFHSPEVNPTPYSYALSALFVACLKDELNEYSYDALLAGMNYKLRLNGSNIYLSTGGYSSKLPILVQRILEVMGSFENHIGDEAFERVKHAKCRSFENMRLEEAHRHAVQQESNLLHERSWSVDDIVTAIRNCSFRDVIAHSKRIFRQLYCDILLYGNLNRSEATDLAGIIVDQVRAPRALTMPSSKKYWTGRQVKLSCGVHYIYKCVHPNPENANCAVNCIYQIGVENYMDRAKLALFSQIVDEPLFDQLRTKEQLGYTVYSTPSRGNGVQSFKIVVQSNVAAPEFIEQRIETFWTELRKMIVGMSGDQLQEHIQSAVKGYIEKPKSQEEEVQALLVEIANHQYEFGRKMKLAKLVRTLQLSDMLQFFDDFIRPGGAMRKKLSVHIYGNETRLEKLANCSETGWSAFDNGSQAGLMAAMALGASSEPASGVKIEFVKDSEDFKRRTSTYELPTSYV
ncbi:Insulin-degrading enzyme [Phytophthora rubi]|uniref:Insulin-degrading enzyme n=1 Tax=Phytophthora rubi TaxID=129364 RepID=A0A6A3JNU9_9STRA|nr:Insulin-degrading enzyme [Phytophthora rubi]KAE9000650.1 Insulin-degrading enzyme [Phytophthora rubi]